MSTIIDVFPGTASLPSFHEVIALAESVVDDGLAVGHTWSFRRSAGQPAERSRSGPSSSMRPTFARTTSGSTEWVRRCLASLPEEVADLVRER